MSGTSATKPKPATDIEKVRNLFPAMRLVVQGKPLAYLDNASTSQKPQSVIAAMSQFYAEMNANIHRGVHYLSEKATDEFESVRDKAAAFIGAGSRDEIVFTKGTTESINLVAVSFVRPRIKSGDEIVLTEMEHHSNIVPWRLLCDTTGAKLRVAKINNAGDLALDDLERLLDKNTKLIAVTHISNVLGTVNPIEKIVKLAKARGVPVLVDGAQAVPHTRVNVATLGCDFYAFSAHKMYGPTGTGVLYGKREVLESMLPYQGGGDMILSVAFDKITYKPAPFKFEAGTPNIAGVIGLGAAIDFLSNAGIETIEKYESDLLNYALERLKTIRKVKVVGNAKERSALVSFIADGIHPHDVGTILDKQGVAIRAGHHCAQPLMERLGIAGTARASFAIYNTFEEIDRLVEGVEEAVRLFS